MLVTKKGREQQLKLIAGESVVFADRFAIGASDSVLTDEATMLDLSWGTFSVTDTVIDYENGQVLFYGTIPADGAGEIREIGLVTSGGMLLNDSEPESFILTFGSNENWRYSESANVDYSTDESKVGEENLEWLETELNSMIGYGDPAGLNFSEIQKVKLKVASNGAAQIKIALYTSEDQYATKLINLVDGDNYVVFDMVDFIGTEFFDPGMVKTIIIESMTSNASYNFDCLVFENAARGGLVAREVIDPIMKKQGSTMEVEMMVALSV